MNALLECRSLAVEFGGLRALDDLSLDVDEGTIVGLIGPNGSGKTTFFNVLTGLVPAAGGVAEFRGRALTGLRPQDIFDLGISRTFQRSRLCLSLSVFDNVVLGRHNELDLGLINNLLRRRRLDAEVRARFEEARALVGIFSANLAMRMFEPVSGMSMIDRRRIEVSRALFAEPSLVLLDEPSAGMTPDETREFMDDILKIRETHPTMTVIIIEHEMDVIQRVADHCVVLNYGKKVSEGAYDAIVNDPWVQEAYLGAQ